MSTTGFALNRRDSACLEGPAARLAKRAHAREMQQQHERRREAQLRAAAQARGAQESARGKHGKPAGCAAQHLTAVGTRRWPTATLFTTSIVLEQKL